MYLLYYDFNTCCCKDWVLHKKIASLMRLFLYSYAAFGLLSNNHITLFMPSFVALTGALFHRCSGRLKMSSIHSLVESMTWFMAFHGAATVAFKVSAISDHVLLARSEVFAVHVLNTFLIADCEWFITLDHFLHNQFAHCQSFFRDQAIGAQIIFFAAISRNTHFAHFHKGTRIHLYQKPSVHHTTLAAHFSIGLSILVIGMIIFAF